MPPARSTSTATYLPPGLRSAINGVRSLTVSKSSIVSGTPASRAIARRCRTALVEPPVAATQAMAFSNALRVRMSLGRTPLRNRSITNFPQRAPTSSLRESVAGMLAVPMGDRPMNSITVAMVLAVYWPPQAPAPGQATSSTCLSSASVMRPAMWAPTASNTSAMVTSRPWKRPGAIDPP